MAFTSGTNVWGNTYRQNTEKSCGPFGSRNSFTESSGPSSLPAFSNQDKILIVTIGPDIKITHLEDPQQVETLQTAPAPWDQAVTWTRGWTGAGWWTVC